MASKSENSQVGQTHPDIGYRNIINSHC